MWQKSNAKDVVSLFQEWVLTINMFNALTAELYLRNKFHSTKQASGFPFKSKNSKSQVMANLTKETSP